jgi:hypothetical protein
MNAHAHSTERLAQILSSANPNVIGEQLAGACHEAGKRLKLMTIMPLTETPPDLVDVAEAVRTIMLATHQAARDAGWWTDLHTGESLIGRRNVGEMLMLAVSEIGEAMEGHRKNLMDDKLPHRPNIEVELADAIIRITDTAAALGLDLGGAVAEKMAFNASRPDHKREARLAAGGKAY